MSAPTPKNDKVRIAGDIGVTVGGAALGTLAAGSLASAAGATAIPFVISAASVFGIAAVASTPVGWVIGATVAGGSLAYGISRLIKNGARVEGQLSEIGASKRHQEHLDQKEMNAKNLTTAEIDAFQELLVEVVDKNGITQEFADQVNFLVNHGDMSIQEAMQTLNEIKTTIIKDEVTQSASEYNALLWILDSQVKQGILSVEQAADLIALVNAKTITEAQALKTLESYLSNFGIVYLLAPIMFKLALLDGVLHPAEFHAIRDYFVREMGYQPSQVDQSINELLLTIEQVSLDDLIRVLALYLDHHHNATISSELKEGIIAVLERVVAADGHVDDQEQTQIARIKCLFSPNDSAQVTALYNTIMMDDLAKQELQSALLNWKDALMVDVFTRLKTEIPFFIKRVEALVEKMPLTFGYISSDNKALLAKEISDELAVTFKLIVTQEANKNAQTLKHMGVEFVFNPAVLLIEFDVNAKKAAKHLLKEGLLNVQRRLLLNDVESSLAKLFSTANEDSYLNQLRHQLNEFHKKAKMRIGK